MSSKVIIPVEKFMSTKGIERYVFLDNEYFTIVFMLLAQNQFLSLILIQCVRAASILIS